MAVTPQGTPERVPPARNALSTNRFPGQTQGHKDGDPDSWTVSTTFIKVPILIPVPQPTNQNPQGTDNLKMSLFIDENYQPAFRSIRVFALRQTSWLIPLI